ncbi:MAG: winged helix-turn-helix domain-containing protein [Candidatus Eiseniibacteriota bacterium]
MIPPRGGEARVLRSHAQAAVLLDPIRLRLLRHMEFPISASGLARRLHLPRQRVNYHVRELERQGLVRLVKERKVGNCTERLIQAVATKFVLSQEMLGGLAADPGPPPAWSLAVEARVASDEALVALERELADAVARIVATHGSSEESGAPWTVTVGLRSGRRGARLPEPRAPE